MACAIEPECAYSAVRLYRGMAERGDTGWPVSVLAWPPTVEHVDEALREGPYGRCVWASDNDVVDHQVVTLRFERGVTASLTMRPSRACASARRASSARAASSPATERGSTCTTSARSARRATSSTRTGTPDLVRHSGGDDGVMAAFVAAVAAGDRALVPTSPAETLASHRIAFAAEAARRERG